MHFCEAAALISVLAPFVVLDPVIQSNIGSVDGTMWKGHRRLLAEVVVHGILLIGLQPVPAGVCRHGQGGIQAVSGDGFVQLCLKTIKAVTSSH